MWHGEPHRSGQLIFSRSSDDSFSLFLLANSQTYQQPRSINIAAIKDKPHTEGRWPQMSMWADTQHQGKPWPSVTKCCMLPWTPPPTLNTPTELLVPSPFPRLIWWHWGASRQRSNQLADRCKRKLAVFGSTECESETACGDENAVNGGRGLRQLNAMGDAQRRLQSTPPPAASDCERD